ncbi:Small subunit (SSU) processome component, partial [Phlyctochytrium bullatum]
IRFRRRKPSCGEDGVSGEFEEIPYKDVYVISSPGKNKVEPANGAAKTSLTAWCDQGSTPFITARASDSRTFVIGSTIAERLRRLLLEQDRLQSQTDNLLNEIKVGKISIKLLNSSVEEELDIQQLQDNINETNRKIVTTLIESTPDPNNADDSPMCKEIANLQKFRKSLQEAIDKDQRRGEGKYEGHLVSRKIKEAEAKIYGVETKLRHADFEQALTTAREEVNQGRRQVNKEAEAVLMDWQKIQAAQKKEIAQAKIDDRISRAVRKLHLEAVDLLSRFDVVYLPKFDVKGMVKTTGNLGPMSKRIVLRLRPAKFLDRLQQRMSLVEGAIFQPDESMTTQYRPLTGEIRSPGRKNVIKDLVLKHHEKKLLKKVDFLQWKSDQSLHEAKVMRRYHVQRREDYIKYNRLVGLVKKIANKLSLLDPKDPYRDKRTDALLEKLYNMGLITVRKSLSQCDNLTVSAFCRRRLPIVMVRLKMAETVKTAVTYVEQGHVRVGPDTITDPAFLVTSGSSIKYKIGKYNDKVR